MASVPVLRPYQQVCINDLRRAYANGARSVLLVSPTGSGKTVTFSYMAQSAASKERRVLVLAHRRELVAQASETFDRFGIDHGTIMAGLPMDRKTVQIGMVQTVARRLQIIAPPDFIIFDESHHVLASQYRKVIDHFPNAKILGVTATPQRTDGRGLGDVFEAMVLGPSVSDLIEIAALSKYRLFCPPQHFDLSGIKTMAGDYHRAELIKEIDRSVVTGDAVDHYIKNKVGRAIAFCVSVEHARHVAKQFAAAGIKAAAVDGGMSNEERHMAMSSFQDGDTRVLCSCDLISEGYDVPAVEAAILLRPTKSVIIYLQQVGRVLRPFPGKDHALIMDHAGNSLRHGLPDENRKWSLDGWKKANGHKVDRGLMVRHCKRCFMVYETKYDHCPSCGAAPDETRKLEIRSGELIEITPEIERRGWIRTAVYGEALASCRSPNDIKEMAKARGYKPQWAIHQTSQQFGMSRVQAAIELGYKPGAAIMMGRDK